MVKYYASIICCTKEFELFFLFNFTRLWLPALPSASISVISFCNQVIDCKSVGGKLLQIWASKETRELGTRYNTQYIYWAQVDFLAKTVLISLISKLKFWSLSILYKFCQYVYIMNKYYTGHKLLVELYKIRATLVFIFTRFRAL